MREREEILSLIDMIYEYITVEVWGSGEGFLVDVRKGEVERRTN